MPLEPGTRLGPYEIRAPLGAGTFDYVDQQALEVLELDTGRSQRLVAAAVAGATFHPSGRWIAYSTGRAMISGLEVRPFPGPGEPIQVARGAQEPRFSRDGRELYYRTSHLMAMPISFEGSRLIAGPPEPLFEDRFARFPAPADGVVDYDVAPDGRFLLLEPVEQTPQRQVLVENWAAKVQAAFRDGDR